MTAPIVLGMRNIPAIPAEVSRTRHWLSGLLVKDHTSIVDDVVLLACELVTNSILHSDSAEPGENGEPGTVTLVVSVTDGAVRVEVIDAGSEKSMPRVIAEDEDALNGRGLYMLAAMSDRWDTYVDGVGRTTWFEITTTKDGASLDSEGR